MKVLMIEATPATPHAETGLEIAIKEKLSGSEVVYAPIFHLLPILVWRSNINGRRLEAGADSLEDWISYLVNQVKEYAEVDVFTLNAVPDYLTEEIRRDPFGFYYDGHDFGALVKSNAVQLFNTGDFDAILQNHLGVCLALAQTAILSYRIGEYLVTRHAPDLVYFFNGRTAGSYPLYLLCQKMGVRTIIHERGATKDKFSIWMRPPQYQDVIADAINDYALGRCPDAARLSAAAFYSRQKSGKITNYGFVNQGQNHDAPIEIPGLHQRYAVYYTTSNFEILLMPGQDVTNALGSQMDALSSLVDVCAAEGLQLLIKMHPGTPNSELENYKKFADGDKCVLILPDSIISSYRLGYSAYRNFSYGSTITWEFLFSGVHCAVLSNTIGRGQGGVVELDSRENIAEYIMRELPPVDRSFAIKFGDYMANYGETHELYRPETLFSGSFSPSFT